MAANTLKSSLENLVYLRGGVGGGKEEAKPSRTHRNNSNNAAKKV